MIAINETCVFKLKLLWCFGLETSDIHILMSPGAANFNQTESWDETGWGTEKLQQRWILKNWIPQRFALLEVHLEVLEVEFPPSFTRKTTDIISTPVYRIPLNEFLGGSEKDHVLWVLEHILGMGRFKHYPYTCWSFITYSLKARSYHFASEPEFHVRLSHPCFFLKKVFGYTHFYITPFILTIRIETANHGQVSVLDAGPLPPSTSLYLRWRRIYRVCEKKKQYNILSLCIRYTRIRMNMDT